MRRHLREYPLGPRHLPGTPRSLRKRQSKCRRTHAGCANAKAIAAGLAQAAQTSRQMPRNSRRLRKRQSKCRGTCAARANVKANAAELAQAAQTPKQMPRDLRGLRKRQSKRRETQRSPRKRQGKCRGTRAGCANVKANAAGTPSRLRDQTRINPAPRAARGGGAARRPYGCFRARCGRARAAADCRGRKNAGRGCRTCRLARRP